MKKYILLLFLLPLLSGCEKDFNTVIDTEVSVFQVSSTSQFNFFQYSNTDSVITLSISFSTINNLDKVFFDILLPTEKKLNSRPVELFDDGNLEFHGDNKSGDKTFSNKFPLNQNLPNGVYTIKFIALDKNGISKQVAVQNFTFNNGQTNIPPVVSNLVAPDTAVIGSDTTFIFLSLDVSDANGLNDIDIVFFNSFLPPDGRPSQNNPFLMFDDGSRGDKVAGDGTYSLTIILPPSGVTKGTFRWEFQAKDRGKKLSNIIIHNIVIK